MSKIFGGSKSKQKSQSTSTQSSSNRAYDPLAKAFDPLLAESQAGMRDYNAFMGGDTTGFETYKKNTGYDFAEREGLEKIIGSSAGRGVFQSGAAGKALQKYGGELNQQYAGNYLDRLLGRVGIGFQAGNSMTGAGGISSGTSKGFMEGSSSSKPGIGSFLGQIAGGVAKSDRRAKKNVYKIGELQNGLNLYQFRYNDDTGPFIGVMADEVAIIQPEALGPIIDGYQTVDYDKIEKEIV